MQPTYSSSKVSDMVCGPSLAVSMEIFSKTTILDSTVL